MDLLIIFYKVKKIKKQRQRNKVQGKEIKFIHSMFTGVKNKEKLLRAKTDGATTTTGD